MPAKLNISKPLRIIGVQIFEKTRSVVKKNLDPGWYPFIKCKNDNKIGTSRDVYPIVSEDVCPMNYYTIDENLPRISVSAIAGKNGSGKSSLIDIVYRFINNFAENTFLMRGLDETDEVGHAFGIEGRLHFELDGVQKFIESTESGTFYYEIVDGEPEKIRIHGLTEKQRDAVLNGFFYTISVNYSLYAFNPSDYIFPFSDGNKDNFDEEWLNYLFHKNDGYYLPMVLTPFRDNGQIDVNNENNLAKQRIEVLSLLFHSQNKEFLEDYIPNNYRFRFNPEYKDQKIMALYDRPIRSEFRHSMSLLINELELLWEKFLGDELGMLFQPTDKPRDENALFYLAYKTLKISFIYPKYKELLHFDELLALSEPVTIGKDGKMTIVRNEDGSERMEVKTVKITAWIKNNKEVLYNLICVLYYSTNDHITVKLHQCLDYLKEKRYVEDEGVLDVDKDLLQGRVFEAYDDMMRQLPPPFFITEVSYLKKNKEMEKKGNDEVTLQSMSSGERQLLYSLSYIYYHIKNIASIKGEDGKRIVGYHHINLVFDEAELYYHPEFQRQYVKRLLERLAYCHINRTNIRSINIIIITHSPFILSDIPETNILFLHKGDEADAEEPQKTLGANVYDLLKNGFFLDYAIGDLVQSKLQEILSLFYETDKNKQRKLFLERRKEMWYTISHLGEDYLKKSFENIYKQLEYLFEGKDKNEMIEEKIRYHQEEVERLSKQLEEQ